MSVRSGSMSVSLWHLLSPRESRSPQSCVRPTCHPLRRRLGRLQTTGIIGGHSYDICFGMCVVPLSESRSCFSCFLCLIPWFDSTFFLTALSNFKRFSGCVVALRRLEEWQGRGTPTAPPDLIFHLLLSQLGSNMNLNL